MALTATLALDIRAFEGGLSRATASLEGFAQKTVKNTNRDLSRMLEEFTGQRVVAESAKMAEAVERIGGASKLTEAEQRRVNATVTEAIEKYRVLGQEAPDNLVKLQAATAQANTGTSIFSGTIARMAAAFSISGLIDKGVSALFSFGAAALKSSSELVDLHNATGASIASLQRWTHVADQGGIQLEDMTKAAFRLGAQIDGGNGSVRSGVAALGLSFTALRDLKPEDQMHEILVAADALGPSQERNAALVDLFGSRGAQALARVVNGYRETAAEAAIAGDAQVVALDKAGDAWSKFLRDISTGFAQTMGGIVIAAQQLGSGIEDLTEKERQQIAFLKKSGGDVAGYIAQVTAAHAAQAASAVATAAATSTATKASASYAAQLSRVNAELKDLKPSERAELDAAKAMGVSYDDLVGKIAITEEAYKLYGSTMQTVTRGHRELASSGHIAASAIGLMHGPSADLLLLESRSIVETGKLTKALELWAKTNSATLAPSIRQVNAAMNEQEPLMAIANANWVGFKGTVTQSVGSTNSFFDRFKAQLGEVGVGAQSLSSLFMQAFTGGGGAVGALKAFATQGLQALMSMIPGIPPWLTQFAGPIVEGLSKLAKKGKDILASMFGGPSSSEKAGRASVAAFEQSLHGALTATQELESGGEDWRRTVIAIRDAYIAAGRTEQEALAAAEKLWKSSTISAEESLRVIEEIKAIMHALPTSKTIEIDVKYNDDGSPANPDGLPTSATQPVGPFIPAAPGSAAMGQMGASQAPVVVVVTTIRRDDIDPVEIGNMAAAAVAQHYPRNGFDLKTIITDSLREA